MPSLLRASGRAPLLLGLTLLLLVPASAMVALRGRLNHGLIRFWTRSVCGLIGLKIRCHGQPEVGRPTLYVANHVSYLDILVLGSLLDAAFVAKAEVAGWPLIGWLAKLGRTLFVERRAIVAAKQRDAIASRLAAGDSLVLFAEGTSSNGCGVLPFKSALFGSLHAADPNGDRSVQPITLAYHHWSEQQPSEPTAYAWYGDMTLLPHLWRILGLQGAEVDVHFHLPVASAAFASRKCLARQVERIVADGLIKLRRAA